MGLGTVAEVSDGRVKILFTGAGEVRLYATDIAPLKRVRFQKGDMLLTYDDEEVEVMSATEIEGIITYKTTTGDVRETLLSDHQSFSGADQRLVSGQIDKPWWFRLRRRTLENQHYQRRSQVRGFVGGRIDLIPHQLYIADEVSRRHAPRVLLSDEVGLGKTIEACLIVHRLLLSGRASRVLVLVPESLVHQWFVEMYRRFNIWLNIFDEQRCKAIEGDDPSINPFFDDQLIVCSIQFLAKYEKRRKQAEAAGWDVLVVDEVHHLSWTTEKSSVEYDLVKAISKTASGLLLLTATPEQLGQEGHFARLHLLDPSRYNNYKSFLKEPKDFESTANLVEKVDSGMKLDVKDTKLIKKLFKDDEKIDDRLEELERQDEYARNEMVEELLDLHGPGRVLFRNTRSAISGFPKRILNLIPLDADKNLVNKLAREFQVDIGESDKNVRFAMNSDPRLEWLVQKLKDLGSEKVLLICRSRQKALAIEKALREVINIKAAVFHEELSLVQRDRNAAWFSEKDGARLLICSEIGSEGRNFQFAHHLVLFDLPLNPELLEQRIGRLDRIGQSEDIQIHVPYLKGSPQEILAEWFHQGLHAFEESLQSGSSILKEFQKEVLDLASRSSEASSSAELEKLIEKTRKYRDEQISILEKGRDRLLEMNSFRPRLAKELVDAIRYEDDEPRLEKYMLQVFEMFRVQLEDLAPHTYKIGARNATTAEAFPSISDRDITVSFDRTRALSREDISFMSWDHPMVTGAMDLVMGSEKGNTSYVILPSITQRNLIIEVLFVLETIADGRLHVDRFLSPTPIRVLVDKERQNVTSKFPVEELEKRVKRGDHEEILNNPEVSEEMLPRMIKIATEHAQEEATGLIEKSMSMMNRMMDYELERLNKLQARNKNIRKDELILAERQKTLLADAIGNARIRLDAIRLIKVGN